MNRVRRFLTNAWRIVAVCSWWGLGVWAALAVFFTSGVAFWPALVLAIGVVALFASARRERFRWVEWARLSWPEKRRSTVSIVVTAIIAIYYFAFVTPDPNLDWAPEQARVPHVRVEADKVYVGDVRNFTWHTATEFTPGFYDREYDLNKLDSMYYVVASMPAWEAVAHVFVCFGFSDGQHVAVSVEGRRQKGVPYQLIPSMFRQYQIIYVVGDERDVVGLRTNIWNKPVYFYPANTTNERKRAIFVDMMERAHKLEEKPEFYHLITNNCMTNITAHLRRLGGRPLPHDIWVLLTGLSDRVAFDFGYIDTDLTFEQARRAFRIDLAMQEMPLDENFSKRIRETIARQVAEVRQEP